MTKTLTVALATPLDPELRRIITDVDPGVQLLVDDDLLPCQRFPGDHDGDPEFTRTDAQQAAFDQLLSRADIWYGIPDNSARLMRRLVPESPRLRWVQTMAAGGGAQVRNARLAEADLARVTFTTSAGVHGSTLAEFALLGVLAGAKNLTRLRALQSEHRWPGRWPVGQISEQTILVVGLGGIGAEVARLLKAFGATVLGLRRRPGSVPDVDEVHTGDAFGDLVGRADAIVFTLPSTDRTKAIYGAELIAATKPGATIVNVGRGDVIDEPAMIEALRSGHLGSAFLDVTATEPLSADSPLWDLPTVTICPHTAALSVQEDRRIAELFADNLSRFIAGTPLRNVVEPGEFY